LFNARALAKDQELRAPAVAQLVIKEFG